MRLNNLSARLAVNAWMKSFGKAPHFVPRSFAYFTGAMQDAVSARSTAGAAPRKPQSTGPFGDPTLDLIARQVGKA